MTTYKKVIYIFKFQIMMFWKILLIFFQKINCFCQLHKEHIRNEITDNKELDEIKEKFDWNDNIREICVLQCGFDWILFGTKMRYGL